MATTAFTQEIARVMRGKLAEENRNRTWFGHMIGRSQSHASQILLGKKPMTVDELALACEAFGLSMVEVVRQAEGGGINPSPEAVPL
jgi:hypothetical protein